MFLLWETIYYKIIVWKYESYIDRKTIKFI